MIGAGLPLFQRLKLLRQRELEKEKQQHQEQETLPVKTEDSETVRSLQQVSVALEVTADCVSGKSTPPPSSSPPSQSQMRDDKQARHISFLDETLPDKKRDYVPIDPPKSRGKSARWTLPGMVAKTSEAAKLGKTRVSRLNTIKQASSSSSAIDSLEQAEPSPPIPPPLPPTPPFWQSSKPTACPSPPPRPQPPLRPPAPHFPGLGMRRKKPPRRAQTMRPEDSPCSVPETDVPYQPIQPFRSMMKQPWHWSSQIGQQSSPPPSSSKSRTMGPAGGPHAGRRFSRQNTIQVVSDVQGVLSDILRDIVPGSKTSNRPSVKPLMANPTVQSPASLDYGMMNRLRCSGM